MGHGAARELSSETEAKKDLDPDDARRLEEALRRFENGDPAFKTSREDEKHQQTSKAWTARTAEIVEDLRRIGKAVVNSHQVLLDMSQDGAGVTATPWIEEAGLKFERLHIRLKGTEVVAEVGQKAVARCDGMNAATYEWLEKAVVEWLIHEATKG